MTHPASNAAGTLGVPYAAHGVCGPQSRRMFLQQSALGFGTLALAHLCRQDGLLTANEAPAVSRGGFDLRPRPGHFRRAPRR